MTQRLSPPRAVIFDWDNTLVDSWACIQAAMNATLTAMGQPEWDMEEIKRRVALSLRDSFPVLFGERWTEARDVFYQNFAAIHLDYLCPLPGVEAMLRQLSDLGVKMAVVSNKNGGFLRQEADRLGWNGLFRSLVGATDAAADKPSAAPVRLVLDAMGVAGTEGVWFVGDAAVDMECAANAGCVGILMREEKLRQGEFDRYPPRRHILCCGDFADLVSELLVPISPI